MKHSDTTFVDDSNNYECLDLSIAGLKILGRVTVVPVQVWPGAPELNPIKHFQSRTEPDRSI